MRFGAGHRRSSSAEIAVLIALGAGPAGCGAAGSLPSPGAHSTLASSGGDVTIRDFAFQQRQITVPAGAAITWTNQDSSVHTVTAADGSFDSGNLGQVQRFSHVFTRPGTHAYRCTIHQYMTGTVVVTG